MSEDGHQRLLQEPVLVLNATYEPINVTAVRRALVLVLKGVATTEEEDGIFLHSSKLTFRVPSVIRLLQFPAKSLIKHVHFAKKCFIARPLYVPVLRPRDAGP